MSLPLRFSPIVFIVLAFFLVSCDRKSPTSPPAPPPPNPGPTVVRLEIVAPAELAPGESVQLTATALKSDGGQENVTDRVQWRSEVPDILDVSSSGLATGKSRGEVRVTAGLDGRSATSRVLVLPKGTYLLNGKTYEFGVPLPGVTLQLLSGVGEGLTTVSGFDGSYAFYGVGGRTRVRLEKQGYVSDVQDLFFVQSHLNRDFGMKSELDMSGYTGSYTLTVFTFGICAPGFPEAAKRRTYTAQITDDRDNLTVRLSDADFILTNGYGNTFWGFNNGAKIYLNFVDYYSPGTYYVVERLGDTAMIVDGYGEGSGPPSRFSGTFGTILISNRTQAPFTPPFASCSARFEMVRR